MAGTWKVKIIEEDEEGNIRTSQTIFTSKNPGEADSCWNTMALFFDQFDYKEEG